METQGSDLSIRAFLLAEAFRFVERAASMRGVGRIALVGSLTGEKDDPKDVDLLVTIEDDADLSVLAAAGRKLKGAAQTRNRGADIFLVNPAGRYIGRICHWRECAPGIRIACDARNCGRRQYLHDDLDCVNLDPGLVKEPPVVIWPAAICRVTVPGDVKDCLLRFQDRGRTS